MSVQRNKVRLIRTLKKKPRGVCNSDSVSWGVFLCIEWLKGFIKGVRGAFVALYLVEKLHYAVLSASTNGG